MIFGMYLIDQIYSGNSCRITVKNNKFTDKAFWRSRPQGFQEKTQKIIRVMILKKIIILGKQQKGLRVTHCIMKTKLRESVSRKKYHKRNNCVFCRSYGICKQSTYICEEWNIAIWCPSTTNINSAQIDCFKKRHERLLKNNYLSSKVMMNTNYHTMTKFDLSK